MQGKKSSKNGNSKSTSRASTQKNKQGHDHPSVPSDDDAILMQTTGQTQLEDEEICITPPPELSTEQLERMTAETLAGMGIRNRERFIRGEEGLYVDPITEYRRELDAPSSPDVQEARVALARAQSQKQLKNLPSAWEEDEDEEDEDEDEDEDGQEELEESRHVYRKSMHTAVHEEHGVLSDGIGRMEDDDEPEPVDVTFFVPQCNNLGLELNKSLTVSSDISFKAMKNKIATIMNIHPSNLSLACRLSSQTANDKSYRTISTDLEFRDLMAIAVEKVAAAAASKAKNKKDFTIQVKNLNAEPMSLPATSTKKSGSGKGANGKRGKSQAINISDIEDDEDPGSQHEPNISKMSVAQINSLLMQKNHCKPHSRHCDQTSTPHVPLSAQNLSVWAMYIKAGGYTSFTVPPPNLGHCDAEPRTRKPNPASVEADGVVQAPPTVPPTNIKSSAPAETPVQPPLPPIVPNHGMFGFPAYVPAGYPPVFPNLYPTAYPHIPHQYQPLYTPMHPIPFAPAYPGAIGPFGMAPGDYDAHIHDQPHIGQRSYAAYHPSPSRTYRYQPYPSPRRDRQYLPQRYGTPTHRRYDSGDSGRRRSRYEPHTPTHGIHERWYEPRTPDLRDRNRWDLHTPTRTNSQTPTHHERCNSPSCRQYEICTDPLCRQTGDQEDHEHINI
ncbi:hypothetical protein VNI00_018239 [Paramarasmius palmivorus]|uniref:Uncharacterized protein n=1 Tax=Paramarasmius palmivorus TaxID=297713 RepID=A0AAW0AZK2_9AGAR